MEKCQSVGRFSCTYFVIVECVVVVVDRLLLNQLNKTIVIKVVTKGMMKEFIDIFIKLELS